MTELEKIHVLTKTISILSNCLNRHQHNWKQQEQDYCNMSSEILMQMKADILEADIQEMIKLGIEDNIIDTLTKSYKL